MKTTLLRPGILVALKSSVSGGIRYSTQDLESDNEGRRKRWETVREMDDPKEHEGAVKVRGKASNLIRKVCSTTTFGLLCPEAEEAELDKAIEAARQLAREFSDNASHTRVDIWVLKARIASTDEQAARAIASEMQDLVARMDQAIDKLDPEAIRKSADEASRMRNMLSDEKSETVRLAVDAARKAARQITQRIQKEGEQAAVVLRDIQRGNLEKARMAFLDMTETADVEPVPEVSMQRTASLDMDDVLSMEA